MQTQNTLKELQDQLKKEWLLLEREQRQKNKVKRQIDDNINTYFGVWVETGNDGRITSDDGFGNCYNFIKDVVLTICKEVQLGLKILLKGDLKSMGDIVGIFLNIMYQNFCQSDPYYKNITKFIILLVKEMINHLKKDLDLSQNQMKLKASAIPPIYWQILRGYLMKDQNRIYFEMKSNKILSLVPVVLHRAARHYSMLRNPIQSCIQISQIDPLKNDVKTINSIGITQVQNHLKSEQQITKKVKDIVKNFVLDILDDAGLFPIGIKIILYTFRNGLKQIGVDQKSIDKFLWDILLPEYLRPLTNSDKRKWNHFRNSHFSELLNEICDLTQKSFEELEIRKIIQKGCSINEVKYEQIFKGGTQISNKITVYGACLTFRQLQLLIRTIKANEAELKVISQRAVNRVRRIFEINPDLFIFTQVKDPTETYVIFKQLNYGTTVENDYLKIYNSTYKNDSIKNILLQILTENTYSIPEDYIPQLHTLKEILSKLAESQQLSGDGIYGAGSMAYSSEFIMKIKYFIWLLEKQEINEQKIFKEMIKESIERQQQFISLFEQTKYSMLRTLAHIQKIKITTTQRKLQQYQIQAHLAAVKIIDNKEVHICITSPSTRSQKYKYIKAGSDQIICESASECIHQDNILTGLNNHATSLTQAIEIFASLKQIKEGIETGKSKLAIYDSFVALLQFFKKQCRQSILLNIKEYEQLQKSLSLVSLRSLHEVLLQRNSPTTQDTQFYQKAKNLSFIQPKNIRLNKQKSLEDFQQLWQITNRYISDIKTKKTPIEKVQGLKQLIYIIKIAVESNLEHGGKVEDFLQIIIAYCLIKAKPQRFISSINFIILFIPKDKLLSREGETLKKILKSISLIQDDRISIYLKNMDENEFSEQFNRISLGQNLVSMKQREKEKYSIPYL